MIGIVARVRTLNTWFCIQNSELGAWAPNFGLRMLDPELRTVEFGLRNYLEIQICTGEVSKRLEEYGMVRNFGNLQKSMDTNEIP